MRAADNWKDYELIDATDGNRLERWGKTILVRPDPQVIWKTGESSPLWKSANAVYHRSASGGGQWEYRRRMPEKWQITYGDIRMVVSPTGFKHTGVFPEQAVNWDAYARLIAAAERSIRVLNLFGYTGGATLACAAAGASVCHVDASKGMVAWGGRMPQPAALRTSRYAGSWMTARNLLRGRSAAGCGTTASLWTRPVTAAARAARCGSWRTASTISLTCARAF